MELSRAFSIAFASAMFASGSGPPSRAATMIARESFEKSCPRFASAAPFLCLMDDHLLCPDTDLLSNQVQESLVHPRVRGQLRMECGDEDPALAQQYRIAVELREDLDLRARLLHAGRTDEDAAKRLVLSRQREIGLEAPDLPPVAVPAQDEIDCAEQRLIRHTVNGVP